MSDLKKIGIERELTGVPTLRLALVERPKQNGVKWAITVVGAHLAYWLLIGTGSRWLAGYIRNASVNGRSLVGPLRPEPRWVLRMRIVEDAPE